MILIEILKHKDNSFLGTWQWDKNSLELSWNGDLSTGQRNAYGQFDLTEKGLYFQPTTSVLFYHHNSKRAEGSKIINKGDFIEIEDLKIKISDYSFYEEINRIEKLKINFKEKRHTNPQLIDLLDHLSKL